MKQIVAAIALASQLLLPIQPALAAQAANPVLEKTVSKINASRSVGGLISLIRATAGYEEAEEVRAFVESRGIELGQLIPTAILKGNQIVVPGHGKLTVKSLEPFTYVNGSESWTPSSKKSLQQNMISLEAFLQPKSSALQNFFLPEAQANPVALFVILGIAAWMYGNYQENMEKQDTERFKEKAKRREELRQEQAALLKVHGDLIRESICLPTFSPEGKKLMQQHGVPKLNNITNSGNFSREVERQLPLAEGNERKSVIAFDWKFPNGSHETIHLAFDVPPVKDDRFLPSGEKIAVSSFSMPGRPATVYVRDADPKKGSKTMIVAVQEKDGVKLPARNYSMITADEAAMLSKWDISHATPVKAEKSKVTFGQYHAMLNEDLISELCRGFGMKSDMMVKNGIQVKGNADQAAEPAAPSAPISGGQNAE